MRHAAKRRYKQKLSAAKGKGSGGGGGGMGGGGMGAAGGALAREGSTALQSALRRGMAGASMRGVEASMHRSEGAGYNYTTFPPLKHTPVFAPQPKLEPPARMIAETARAAVEHDAAAVAAPARRATRGGAAARAAAAWADHDPARATLTPWRVACVSLWTSGRRPTRTRRARPTRPAARTRRARRANTPPPPRPPPPPRTSGCLRRGGRRRPPPAV